MAAGDANPVPKKGVPFRWSFAIRDTSGQLVTSWAGADTEISKDSGAFADCTNEATEIGTSGCGYIDLTADEMNADCVIVRPTVTNTDARPPVLVMYPEESGDYRVGSSTVVASVTGSVGSVASFGTLVSDVASAVWSAGTRTLTAISDSSGITTLLTRIVGTLASGTHNPQTGDAYARLGAPAGASVSADIAAVKAKTDLLVTFPTNFSSLSILGSGGVVVGTNETGDDLATTLNTGALQTILNKLDGMLVQDGAVYQYTANALELGPAGSGGGSAAQVWDYLTADADTTGSMGKLIVDKLGLISSNSVQYASPVAANGSIPEIIIGDDYYASESRAFEWTVPAVSGVNAADVTVRFGGEALGDVNGSWLVEGSATDAGGGNWDLSVNLPASATENCEPGFYNWSTAVHLTANGREITKVRKGKNNKTQLVRKYT